MCNIKTNTFIDADRVITNSYRSSIYNTFQHEKKFFNYNIKANYNNSNINLYADSLKSNITNIIQKVNLLFKTKIRVEGYFKICSQYQLDDALQNILTINSDIKFLAVEPQLIISYIRVFGSTILKVVDYLVERGSEREQEIILLFIYQYFISGFFSLNQINSNFVKNHSGLFLLEVYFN